jgi:beta-lactamase regulating signal transducer with metallopeptidase domain
MTGLASGALVAAVWQGILLACVVGLGLRLLPKTPAAVRFAIWFGVFGVVAALPFVSAMPHAAGVGGRGAWLTIDSRWSVAIAAVWAVASLARAVQLAVAAVRVRALWKRATPVEVGALQQEANAGILRSAQNDSLKTGGDSSRASGRRAQLCVSDEVDRPTVIGFLAPRILIPGWLLERLTPEELEQVVLHECGHLGRADDWMNLVQKIALVVFPLNPALAWVERRLCFERELACDERVLRASEGKAGAAKAYAACLVGLAEQRLGRRGLALAIGLVGRESELGQRVGRILRRSESMRPVHAKLVLGGAMLALLVAAAGMERCPQLVGFEARSREQAAGNRELAAGNGEQGVGNSRQGVAAREVVWREPANGDGAAMQWVPRVVTAHSRVAAQTKVWESRPFDRIKASGGSPGLVLEQVPRAEMAPDPRVEMVEVTAWEREDGARVVLTTVRTREFAGAQDLRLDADDGQPVEQVHPYAAVPVRGGWLVFQL